MNESKCVCGYEYDYDTVLDDEGRFEKSITKGDEDFISVNVVATISKEYRPDQTVQVLACPICGTLQIDMY